MALVRKLFDQLGPGIWIDTRPGEKGTRRRCYRPRRQRVASRPEPEWNHVHRELQRQKGVTLQLPFAVASSAIPDGGSGGDVNRTLHFDKRSCHFWTLHDHQCGEPWLRSACSDTNGSPLDSSASDRVGRSETSRSRSVDNATDACLVVTDKTSL